MKKKLYYKLVRDRIPEAIEAAGRNYQVSQLYGDDLMRYAMKKLREEVQEFIENPCAEEGGDILEIFDFICECLGIKPTTVRAERISKHVIKGGFDRGLLLEWVDDI